MYQVVSINIKYEYYLFYLFLSFIVKNVTNLMLFSYIYVIYKELLLLVKNNDSVIIIQIEWV